MVKFINKKWFNYLCLKGRNKMVINHLEKLFVTNDAATIMKELDVVHPAAKLLSLASQQQEAEVLFFFIGYHLI